MSWKLKIEHCESPKTRYLTPFSVIITCPVAYYCRLHCDLCFTLCDRKINEKYKVKVRYLYLLDNQKYSIFLRTPPSCNGQGKLDVESGQSKDYANRIYGFPNEHVPLNRKNKDWLTRNQDNFSEWSNTSAYMMTVVLTVSYNYMNPTQHIHLIQM